MGLFHNYCSYCPNETTCHYCCGNLSDPKCVTSAAKLLTLKGLIQGISMNVKFCEACQMPYRYQEYCDGIHNFNDNWLMSLGICDMIRKHIQVSELFDYTLVSVIFYVVYGFCVSTVELFNNTCWPKYTCSKSHVHVLSNICILLVHVSLLVFT